jgi:hypothetical protein
MSRHDRNVFEFGLGKARLDALAVFFREAEDLADLPHRLTGSHGGGERDVEAAAAAGHRDRETRIRHVVNMIRHACGLAAKQEDVSSLEAEIRVGQGGFGREQHKPPPLRPSPMLEAVEVEVAGERRHFEIIHASASERPVRHVEAGRLDDVDANAEAGGEPEDRAGIAGDIRLVEGDAQSAQFRQFLKRCLMATPCQDGTKNAHPAVAIRHETVYRAAIFNSNRWRRIWNS